jgi:glycosyltransferase involved in cell wall biosynthesis
MLAHPALGRRLPNSMPVELIPGFVPGKISNRQPAPGSDVRFLYSGTLDSPRGVDLLLESIKLLPSQGWQLDITGHGPLAEKVAALATEFHFKDRVHYHQSLPPEAYEQLKTACHAGLNCQRISDPISGVTFPSKVFTYFSAGLLVVSSRASEVDTICGKSCIYYDEETPQALAAAMTAVITDFAAARTRLDSSKVIGRFAVEATTARLQKLLRAIGWPK